MHDGLTAPYDDEVVVAPRDPAAAIKRLLALSVLAAAGLLAWNVFALFS